MNPESDHNLDDDPTTPFVDPLNSGVTEELSVGATEEMPLPDWASNSPTASSAPPPPPTPAATDTQVQSFFGAAASPPPPPPQEQLRQPAIESPSPPLVESIATPLPGMTGPTNEIAGPTSEASGPVAPAARSTYAGPTTPNYADTGPSSPTSFATPARRSFAPAGPPNPPEGPGKKPKSDGRISRWGWRSLIAFLAGGMIAAAGFAAGEINDADQQAAGPTPTSIVVQSSGSASGNVIVETSEPAALVAQRLGPSVVQVETDFGLGSGVIYRDGYILTNNHVVDGAQTLKIRLSNGENFDATLVGTDESKDLAVLSVGDGRNLPIADLAVDQEIQVGQIAIAIGSPFQLQQTVTAGIVSAVDRPIPSRTPGVVVAMIQTDAPINPGNSGGALADKNGRVIGINTAIQTDGFSGTNAGVGFAIPIDDAVRIADLLVAGDPIEAGFLGVTGRSPEDGSAGVEIVEVTSGSAAESAGLQSGDRVLSLDGAPVTQIQELAGLVLAHQAGDEVTLEVVRGEDEIQLEAVLGIRE